MKTWIPDARNFAYLTWKQVDALPRESTLLVLPTAAIEQHGHHLPLATDTLINNLLLGKALAKLPAELPIYALPPVCYGKSNEHIGFPGNALGERATFMAVVRDLGASICRRGISRSSCSTTRMAAIRRWWTCWRAICARSSACALFRSWLAGANFEGLSEQERTYGFHAGEVETAFLLASVPELGGSPTRTPPTTLRMWRSRKLLPESAQRHSHGSRATLRRAA